MSVLTNFSIFFTERRNKVRTRSETDEINVSFPSEEEKVFPQNLHPDKNQGRFENPAEIFFVEKDGNIYSRPELIESKLVLKN